MTKIWKQFAPAVAGLLIIATTAAGCGSAGDDSSTASGTTQSTEASQSSAQEPAKKMSANLKILLMGEESAGQKEVNKAVEDKLKADGFDFTLDYVYVPSNDYANKQTLVASSGEDMDITWAHKSTINDQVAKGMYAPLDEALKSFGSELVSNTPDYSFKEVTVDGKIYAIPRVAPAAQNDWVVSIRGDLRKKYNIPEIKTLADFEAYADALSKNEKQMTPIYLQSPRELYRVFNPTYFFPAQGVYIDLADPNLTVKNYWESEAYKKFCDKYYEWVQKGWATKDSTKIKLSSNDFIAGKIGTCYGNVLFPTEKIDALKAVSPDGEIESVSFNPDQPKYIELATDNLLSVFAQSKKVNESVAFINWIRSSQENYDLMSYGISGTNYNVSGDSVSIEGIAKEHVYAPKSYTWTDLRFNRYSKNVPAAYIDTIKNWDKNAIQSPLLGMAIDTTAFSQETAKLQTVIDQYNLLMEHGLIKYDDKKDEMLSKAKAAGMDTIISEIQKQVDAFKSK